jgi:O-Antigen ligase
VNMQAIPSRLTDAQRRPSGTLLVLSLGVVGVVAVVGAWLATSVFVVAVALLLGLVGYSAWRWPRATLVCAVLATLADPYVVRGLIPSEMSFLVTGFSEALVGTAGLVILVHGVRSRSLIGAFRDPVTVFGALFAGVAVASAAVNGVPPLVAGFGIIATLDAVAVYFMARILPFDRRAISLSVAALVATATVAALLGIAQALLTPQILWFQAYAGRFGEGARVSGFMGNPNLLAALIGVALPFALFGTLHLPARRGRWLAMATLFILTFALILTFSRGAWVAVILGVAIGTLLVDWRLLVVMAGTVLIAYLLAGNTPRNLLVDPNDLPPYGSEDAPPDIFDALGNRLDYIGELRDLRLRYIVEGIPILLDNPVLGVGPGRYGGAVARITDSPVYEEYGTSLYGYRTVHNFWLHTFGEVGALGLAVFLTMVIGLVVRFARQARRTVGLDRLLLGGAATTLIVVMFNNLTEMIFEGNSPAFVIWLVLGLCSLLAPVAWPRGGATAVTPDPADIPAPEAPAAGSA